MGFRVKQLRVFQVEGIGFRIEPNSCRALNHSQHMCKDGESNGDHGK